MFWDWRDFPGDRIAVSGDEGRRTYAELEAACARLAEGFRADEKKLVLLSSDTTLEGLQTYLALLRAGHAVWIADPSLDPALTAELIRLYRPDWILQTGSAGARARFEDYEPLAGDAKHQVRRTPRVAGEALHPNLALLLSTSGTTGNPKLVRLSYGNLAANAASIREYLGIVPADVAATTLPFYYSYGLSVIHSHLSAGARILLTRKPLAMREFWTLLREEKCTFLAGVPYTFQTLRKIGFDRMELPDLRTLTQAGGRLDVDHVKYFEALSRAKGFRFFVMYGQTEATARIAYVPPDRLAEKPGSIGIAIPGGTMEVWRDGKALTGSDVEGELVYRGANVMMGYAESRQDLNRADEMGGTLHTGDIVRRDAAGFHYLVGRLKRFVKLSSGLRIHLDDAERRLEREIGLPVACFGLETLHVAVAGPAAPADLARVREFLQKTYRAESPVIFAVETLPRTTSGKIDYPALERGSRMEKERYERA